MDYPIVKSQISVPKEQDFFLSVALSNARPSTHAGVLGPLLLRKQP